MSWTDPAYEAIARLVGERTGLAFAATRRDSAEQGIRRAMVRGGVTDPARFLEQVAGNAGTLDELIAELTVGETYFFREPGQFQFLRRVVLPDLRQRRGEQHMIRAWSAGCASGEEAYSLAMLLDQEGLGKQSHIAATDVSRTALAKSREALYGHWSLRGDGANAALPYLIKTGRHFRVRDDIQRRVSFDYLNLVMDVYPSFATGTWAMDLILCRNVLIYLDPQAVRIVAQRLFDTLAEGGWLLTASSDPHLGNLAPFTAIVADEGVFYRRQTSGAPIDGQEYSVRWPAVAAPEALAGPAATIDDPQSWTLSPRENPPDNRKAIPANADTETASAPAPAADPLHASRAAFAKGDYARVVQLTSSLTDDPAAAVLHVRALANVEAGEAEAACAAALERHAGALELGYLHAVLLLEMGRDEDAIRAIRRVLYFDRSLAIAHFTLGSLLRRRGNLAGARRAYRNARDLCAARPADELVPLADGEQAGRLAAAADAQTTLLDVAGRPTS